MGQIRTLDLEEVDLYGWEWSQNSDIIEQFVRRIKAGQPFDPVPVQHIEDRYELVCDRTVTDYRDPRFTRLDGGHRRSRAHYLARVPLVVEIVTSKVRIPADMRVHVREMSTSHLPQDYHEFLRYAPTFMAVPR